MKKEVYKYPKSSFLSVDKDMVSISNYIFKNENLKKLIYYTSQDAMSRPELTEDQSIEIFQKNFTMIPKEKIDPEVLNYIILKFDNYMPTSNPQFRDNTVEIDILCHYDVWNLKDFQLRPYRIAAEIDSMLNNAKLSGIGTLQFFGGSLIQLNDEYGGVCLMYNATHGGDDKVKPVNPDDEQVLIDNFDKIFNSGE